MLAANVHSHQTMLSSNQKRFMETISDPESSRRPHVLRSGDRIGVQRHAGAIRAAAIIPTTLRLALLSFCLKNGKRMPATGFGCVAVGPASRWFRQFLNPTKPGKTIVSEKNLNGQRPSRLLSRKNLRSERRRADPSYSGAPATLPSMPKRQ